MAGSHAQYSRWALTLTATLGAALASQACSGRVQDDSDCRSSSSCAGGASGGHAGAGNFAGAGGVTPSACENGTTDANESDVDCGGSSKCERCVLDMRCKTNTDCATDFCSRGRCAEPTCTDHVKNQDETDVDCGGRCLPCDLGTSCVVDEDCSNQYCFDGVCGDHCLSGARDADETDEDCGGSSCSPCADNQRCRTASDCESRVCSGGSCRVATCKDRIKNQDETEIDCGGVCRTSRPCATGARCNTPDDCESWICSAGGKCVADIVILPADVIDDFEDDDLTVSASPALGASAGNWFAFGDGTGLNTVGIATVRRGASSVYGLRAAGMNFTSWGSGFGLGLNTSGGQNGNGVFDASRYRGITFWARAEDPTALTVSLSDVDTDAAGKLCTTCGHHFYKALQLTPNWQRFTIAFSDLVLEPGTTPSPTAFKPSAIVSLLYTVPVSQDYDLYFDDFAFLN